MGPSPFVGCGRRLQFSLSVYNPPLCGRKSVWKGGIVADRELNTGLTFEDIIQYLEDLEYGGLFTNTRSNRIALERFKSGKSDTIKVIVTNGVPAGTSECSQCRKQLDDEEFSYYQARVNKRGYLSRSNALCRACSGRLNAERKEILDQADIPPKPAKGGVCPKCNRKWWDSWHRDHSYETEKFRGWIYGNCNMRASDRRNPPEERQ